MVLSREELVDEIEKSRIAIKELKKGVFINEIVLEGFRKALAIKDVK